MGWFSRWFGSEKGGVKGAAGGVSAPVGRGPRVREGAVVRREIRGEGVRAHRIETPVVGFLNLAGADRAGVMKRDREELGHAFVGCRVSAGEVPRCDVLFVYCDVGAEGEVVGRKEGVWELAKAAGARVMVVASENAAAHCRRAVERRKGEWGAYLVMTVDRKGDVLADFFRRLFHEMFTGRSIAEAWAEMSPRIEGVEYPDAPEVVVAAEVGEVRFGKGEG